MFYNSRNTYIEINITKLFQNYNYIKSITKADIRAVVKANAYGHGVQKIVYFLNKAGIKKYAVAFIEEAIEINKIIKNSEILIFNYCDPYYLKMLCEKNIYIENFIFTIYSVEQLKKYIEVLEKKIKKIKFEIKINTGMNRLGISKSDDIEFINYFFDKNNELLKGVYSHFYDSNNKEITDCQFENFLNVCKNLNFDIPKKHIANSAGFFLSEKYHLDEVRIGMALYGLQPLKNKKIESLKQILSWKSIISNIMHINKGENIGYGSKYKALEDKKIGIIPIGYSDGYNYYFENNAYVVIKNKKCKIIGEISMEQIIADITEIENIAIGETVYVLGGEKNGVCIGDIAKIVKTVPDNITSSISKDIIRVHREDDIV